MAPLLYLPKGDATQGRILGRTVNGKPVDGALQVKGPFHLAVDQQDRIWVTNGGADMVTRSPASDPGKAEQIKVGYGPRAIAIDSLGNAWVANTLGHPGLMEKLALVWNKIKLWFEGLFASSESEADKSAKAWISLYGHEQWDALPKEIERCVAKIAAMQHAADCYRCTHLLSFFDALALGALLGSLTGFAFHPRHIRVAYAACTKTVDDKKLVIAFTITHLSHNPM